MSGFQHAALDSCINKQSVQPFRNVETVSLAPVGGIFGIRFRQFGHGTQHGVRAAYFECRMPGHFLLEDIDVFGPVPSAEEIAHHRKENLAVLIAGQATPSAKIAVNVRHDMPLKLVRNEKMSAKGREIPKFNLYSCHAIQFFA